MNELIREADREVHNEIRRCIKKVQRSTELDKDDKKMIRTALENMRGQRPEKHMLAGRPIYSCRMCGKIVNKPKPKEELDWTFCWKCGAMQLWS